MIFILISTIQCLTLLFVAFSISKSSAQVSYSSLETEHFIIYWEAEETTKEEVQEAKEKAESIFTVYQGYLGKKRLSKNKISIYLSGQAMNMETGEVKIPYVDTTGSIYIYRFPHGYFGELAHEMVHSFRIYKGFSGDWFLEEGFAESLAAILFPETIGFVRYGYSITVAAGVWKQNKQLIPLRILKDKHAELSTKCPAQSYALRADFFIYIESKYGKERFLNFAYGKNSKDYNAYTTYFENDFDQLVKHWQINLQKRIDSMTDFQIQKQDYLNNTGIRYMKICDSCVDY